MTEATFAPLVKKSTICALFSVASEFKMSDK